MNKFLFAVQFVLFSIIILSGVTRGNINNSFIPDSTLFSIIKEINADSIAYNIQQLENFGTRYRYNLNRLSVANWIKNRYTSFGIKDVVLDTFLLGDNINPYEYNVIATIKGKKYPDQVILIGGHYDTSCGESLNLIAPGADDDASGTSAAIEIARAIQAKNYTPDYTLKFVGFASEEGMLSGNSGAYNLAYKMQRARTDLFLMINLDMIANTDNAEDNTKFKLMYPEKQAYLFESFALLTKKFSKITKCLPSYVTLNFADAGSFLAYGFPTVYLEEASRSDFVHSTNDLLKNCNIPYCTEITRAAAAILLSAYPHRSIISDLNIKNNGDGKSISLSWNNLNPQEYKNYRVKIGTKLCEPSDTIHTTLQKYTLTNLTCGTLYYFGISAIDNEGKESHVYETTFTPFISPLPPANVSDIPSREKIQLSWNKNTESDLRGYNIYRSETKTDAGVKIQTLTGSDTVFIDAPPAKGLWYYYRVTAFDSSGKESINNTIIKSRVISFDKGVMVVNSTTDGNGTFMKPALKDVKSFYNSALADSFKSSFDLNTDGEIKLADMGDFNVVVWHTENNRNSISPLNYKTELKRYLDMGGKLIFTGFRPSTAFENKITSPCNFTAGDFIFDYLKIEHSEINGSSQFCAASSADAFYNNQTADSIKNSSKAYITNIESITPNKQAKIIYSYNSRFTSDQPEGAMKGLPVGIEYMGDDYKVITISFPLYYMNTNDAAEFLKRSLKKLNGTVYVENDNRNTLPKEFQLYQNYPNPFNPQTVIKFDIAEKSFVELIITDILGKEVCILLKEEKSPGKYQVSFKGANLSSGIYFYTLHTGGKIISRKMLLLK